MTVETTDWAQTPVFVRGGFIVPRRERPRRSSTAQAGDPYTLLVALDTTGRAQGHLYEDDGLTTAHQQGAFVFRTFTFAGGKLTCVHHSSCPMPTACLPAHGWDVVSVAVSVPPAMMGRGLQHTIHQTALEQPRPYLGLPLFLVRFGRTPHRSARGAVKKQPACLT